MKEHVSLEIAQKLTKIYMGLYSSGKKMFSAANHIDHYIHDILDYTILSDDNKHLNQNLHTFDI